jgi:cytochrome b561/polyisoprenoid-binding protein YceI
LQLKNTHINYGATAKFFHWAVALLVIGLLALGTYMTWIEFSPFKLELYGIHKSFGTLVFILALLRVVWRWVNPKPEALQTHKKWEKKLAHYTHILLYVFLFAMPLSGWLMTSAAAFPHHFFGFFNVPALTGKDESLFKLMRNVHELSSYGLAAIIALHFAGAMKHHIMDRDLTLKRMMPQRPMLLLAVLLFVCTGLVVANNYNAAQNATADNANAVVVREDAPVQSNEVAVQENAAGAVPAWEIIKEDSNVSFTATVQGTAFDGGFERFDGEIQFDPENLAASRADIKIDLASVKSGSSERDEYMVAPAWFNTESFPESQFLATEFQKIDENQYVAVGDLRIKDTSMPVSLPFTLTIETDEAGNNIANMQGELTIERLDYGLGEGQWGDLSTVANEVLIRVSVKARQVEGAGI